MRPNLFLLDLELEAHAQATGNQVLIRRAQGRNTFWNAVTTNQVTGKETTLFIGKPSFSIALQTAVALTCP